MTPACQIKTVKDWHPEEANKKNSGTSNGPHGPWIVVTKGKYCCIQFFCDTHVNVYMFMNTYGFSIGQIIEFRNEI